MEKCVPKVFFDCLDWLEKKYNLKTEMHFGETTQKWFREQIETKFPDYFWYTPASISLKHHPNWALGSAGMQMHTLAVAQTALDLIEARYSFTGSIKPSMYVASIYHDAFKYGIENHPMKDRVYHKMHMLFPRFVFDEPEYISGFGGVWQDTLEVIEAHMGRWSPPGYKPETDAQWILHEADYIVSREGAGAPEVVEKYRKMVEI